VPSAGDDLGSGARRRVVAGVLAASMAVAILPVISVGVLAPILIDELAITRVDIGLLVSAASGVSAVASPAAGSVVDRVGDRTALLAVFGAGAISLTLMAAAADYAAMALALVVAGVCHAGSNPATNRVISGRVPLGRRGIITGVKQSGETVAIVMAAALLPGVAIWLGWRTALALLAAGALLALLTAAWSIHGSHRPVRRSPSLGSERLRPAIYWLSAYSFAMGAASGAVTAYLPLYAHDSGGFSVAAAGGVMVLAGVVGTVGRIAATRWTETRLGAPLALVVLAALGVVSGVLLIVAPAVGASTYWLAAAIWGASGLTFGSVGMLAVMAEADGWSIGRASGLAVFGFGVGLTITPPIFGWLVDLGHGYGAGFGLVTAFYVLAVGIMVLGRSSFRDPGPSAIQDSAAVHTGPPA
jgi:predicted MFS family arabinose efflux permease